MSKPRLCEILGVEPMEEFRDTYTLSNSLRVNKEGHMEERSGNNIWMPLSKQALLENLIERGITRPLQLSAQQLSFLRALSLIFRAENLFKDHDGLFIQGPKGPNSGGRTTTRIPEGSCLDELFNHTSTNINILGLLHYYEEVPNV